MAAVKRREEERVGVVWLEVAVKRREEERVGAVWLEESMAAVKRREEERVGVVWLEVKRRGERVRVMMWEVAVKQKRDQVSGLPTLL